MVKSIGGKWAVRCREVVRFSEGPLLEVLLYDQMFSGAWHKYLTFHREVLGMDAAAWIAAGWDSDDALVMVS